MLLPTDPEVCAFLGKSMIAHVATLSPKRRPFVTPLWFVADGGSLYMTTGPETWVGRNVAQHPAVTLLFRGERMTRSDRTLRVRGTATCHRGFPPWRVLLRVAAKYYLAPAALRTELANVNRWPLRLRYYAQVKGGVGFVLVVPTDAEFLPEVSPS
jgi:hypothetical protein